jgi:hypothetical protein
MKISDARRGEERRGEERRGEERGSKAKSKERQMASRVGGCGLYMYAERRDCVSRFIAREEGRFPNA